MSNSESVVRQFKWRLQAILAARYALAGLTLWGFGWGIMVLLVRAGLGTDMVSVWWALTGLLPVGLGVAWFVRRLIPDEADLHALIDSSSQAGGLVMTELEAPLGGWQATVPALQAPAIRWQAGKPLAVCLLALLFMGASHLIPKRFIEVSVHQQLDVSADVDQLEAQLSILEQEDVLSPEQVDELKEQLATVVEHADGSDPVKTWEALDHLQQTVEQAASQAGEAAIGETAKLTEAELLAEALQQGVDSDHLEGAANRELASLLEELLQANPELAETLGAAPLADLQSGNLSKEQLEALKNALREGKAGIEYKVGRLVEARLVDGKCLSQCKQAGQAGDGDLVAFLKEASENGASLEEALLAYRQGSGRGGLQRGPGHAPLNPGAPTAEEGLTFKEEVLPAAGISSLEGSDLLGVTLGTPDSDSPELSQGSAVRASQAGAGSSHTHRILPRHRATIERYFERE